MKKTEFFEAAVRMGYYGLEKGGLFGKKDNVRKYWEDISVKLCVTPFIEQLLKEKKQLRIVDLGAGSGEGFELLTHIPIGLEHHSDKKFFLMDPENIEEYLGIDISPAMIEQGRCNYEDRPNVSFEHGDLSEGFPVKDEKPFDLYFSSYASLSHLSHDELFNLTCELLKHAREGSIIVYDLFGRFSPEWPVYWSADCHVMLPYNMAYLQKPQERKRQKAEPFPVTFWASHELEALFRKASETTGRAVAIDEMRDRSIFVGRHIDTGLFNNKPQELRWAVNCLFDRDYRGQLPHLSPDLSYLEGLRDSQGQEWRRIRAYFDDWMAVISIYEALLHSDDGFVRKLIESSRPDLSEELKMLAWLYKNASRFPVVDFWASVIGPQIACVLRGLEFMLPRGLGCGHGLFCIARVKGSS